MIRAAETQDAAALASLMRAYIVDFYRHPDPGHAALTSFIQHLLDHPEEGFQLVSETDGALSGFVTCYLTYSTLRLKRISILNDLYVDPAFRGRHIGEELFTACLDTVRRRGLDPMQWETARDNTVAQSLYRKMGGELSPWLHYELA